MRKKRRELSPQRQRCHAEAVAGHIVNHPLFHCTHRIACYLPANGEIDPIHIMEAAWRRGKHVYLPVLSALGHSLLFAPYHPNSDLKKNRYGILEPSTPLRHCLRARHLQLILMPLVAFDSRGNRLGMGGGYYDRSLAFRRHQKNRKSPKLIGLAHDFQRVAQLPFEAWDVPLDAIVSERRIYPTDQTLQT